MELNPEIIYSALGYYVEDAEFRQRYGKLLRQLTENHLNKHSKVFLKKVNEVLFKTGSVNLSEVEFELTRTVSEGEADTYFSLLNTIKKHMSQYSAGFVAEKLDEIFVSFELEKTLASLNGNPFSNLQKLKRAIFHIEASLQEMRVGEAYTPDQVKDILDRSNVESSVVFPVSDISNDLPLRGGDLGVIAGYTSVGKTWFLLNSWVESVKNNKKVIFFTLELTATQIIQRLATVLSNKRIYSKETSIEYFDINKNTVESEEIEITDSDSLVPLVIDFLSKTQLIEPIRFTVYDLASYIEAYLSDDQSEGRLDCIIIDGLEHIEVPEAKYKDTWQIISRAVLHLKSIARKYDIAILTMSQVQKAKEQKKTITIRDIAGGGEIGRVASLVLTLNQTPEEYLAKVMRIYVAKERVSGFHKGSTYFVNALFPIGKWLNCKRVTKPEEHDSLSAKITASVKDIQALNFINSDFEELPDVDDL